MTIMQRIKAINEIIAENTTRAVGTMWCVYTFAILVLLPFGWPNLMAAIQYISSGFLQLVLLPLLMVGSAILSRSSEAMRIADHKLLMDEIQMLRGIIETIENLPCKGRRSEGKAHEHTDYHLHVEGPEKRSERK